MMLPVAEGSNCGRGRRRVVQLSFRLDELSKSRFISGLSTLADIWLQSRPVRLSHTCQFAEAPEIWCKMTATVRKINVECAAVQKQGHELYNASIILGSIAR